MEIERKLKLVSDEYVKNAKCCKSGQVFRPYEEKNDSLMKGVTMAINLEIVGKELKSTAFTYTKDQVILYALGVGAGLDELDFIYEKNLKVLPSFGVIPFMSTYMNEFVPKSNINIYGLLHGEHQIVLHKPIPVSGTIYTTTICESVYDKGDNGAMLNLRFVSHDESGELLFENRAVAIDRTAGNFGGDRGPKKRPVNPPEGRKPDFRVPYTVSSEQCALYRLSGDKNPLHIDPDFAKKVGFDRPILHGLCSMGIAVRAILKSLCNGEPNGLRSFSLRFINAAYPGDTLTTQGWRNGPGEYIIQMVNQDGRIILGNAMAQIAS